MNKNALEFDCTRHCRSRNHGQILTSAITKRSVSDQALASFIKATCASFTQAFDFQGRTALHMAAARGRINLVDWLVRHSSEAFINARDRESGYTPLHRSVFYGQIHTAVALMKIGVNTEIVDKDDYKAIDHAMLDHQYLKTTEKYHDSDVYVWGSNSNYTLGTGTQQQRNTPELLSCFSRSNICIKQICLGKFHTVWISAGGEVWCCGQLNRAGAPNITALRPIPLSLMEPCICAAITLNSTVFLLESGTVIQYTLNNTGNVSQSNTKTPSTIKLPYVKPLFKLSEPIGVCSSRFHAAVWNTNGVYTWGTNLGQLGHSQEVKIVSAPKRVAITVNNKEEAGIQLVSAADAATVITTSRGDVYLLSKHICKKIAIKQINLRQVCVEGKVNDQGVCSRITVLLLTTVGQLLLWQDTTNILTRCVFGMSHQTVITTVSLTHDTLYFTTKYGEAFLGTISRKTTTPNQQQIQVKKQKDKDNNKSALVKFLEKDDCTSVWIRKIPNIHRAISIAVDTEGLNLACLQIKPTCGLRSLPELSPSCMYKHMESLLETVSENDILHDVVFKVDTKRYPAHMFVIESGSEHLYKLYQENLSETGLKPVVVLNNVHPDVFERILRFLYTGTCDVAEQGPCGLKIRREDLITEKKEKENVEIDVELIEDMLEMSAYEVYKQQNEKNSKKRRRRPAEVQPKQHVYCDPVKLVQATAKRLQVMGLHKILDKFYYRDGTVCLKESATYSKNPVHTWDRNNLPELHDTNVCSKDGVMISAHKCILAARLEYFHGMFLHSWSESTKLSNVNLPLNHGILTQVIDFLYTDKCPEVENSDSIDYICSMLIVADQLFIVRLREMCEMTLSKLISLKNCAELSQFAHTYNATQLKQCCLEFISLNLSNILENKTLDVLESEVLEDITNYYCKFNPIMSSRIITPFYNAPADEVIDECAKFFPVNLEITDDNYKRNDEISESKKRNRNSKKVEYTESEKARMRYESVSSVTSLDLSVENSDFNLTLDKTVKESEKGARDKQEKWIEVSSMQQKQQKVIQARLKAISSAKDISNESHVESFTKLTKNSSTSNVLGPQDKSIPSTSWMSVSPQNTPMADIVRSPQGNLTISHVGPKLSQKQRKKLALQDNEQLQQNITDELKNVRSVKSPTDRPKNAWNISESPVATSSPKSNAIVFNQILADQKKQKDDSSRIMSKPLALTQLEDKAIEELERFYNVHDVDDELITVRRIELQVSSPQWINNASKS